MPQWLVVWFAEMIERLRADEALHEVAVLQMGSGQLKAHDFRARASLWERLATGPAAVPERLTPDEFEARNALLGFVIEKQPVGPEGD